MNLYFFVKTLHIISATILFGTGVGIAFFMFHSQSTNNLDQKLYAVSGTVLADYLFTLPAVIIQFATGAWLVWKSGYESTDFWLLLTYCIYVIAGLCWIPVVFIQIKLKNILAACAKSQNPLPLEYNRLFRAWFILGWPAFIGLVAVFFLMVFKPV